MTVTASTSEARSRPVQIWLVVWACALAAVLAVFLLQDRLPWAVNYPAGAIVPVADWVSALMNLIKSNFSWLTRSITAALSVPLDFALNLLAKNFKFGRGAEMVVLPRLSWVGVCIAAFLAGRAAGGWKLGTLVGGCFLYIALFGQWTSAMLTLGLISIAVPFCIVTGLFVGVWAWRKPWAERLLISPALDLMQTIPTFAYLIPMLLLFGNSPVSAMIATAIFATPPMVRATMLGLSRVPSEIDDFSEMAGCTARQKLWRVLLPSARPALMVGVNQVIMLALNMVIIASMIGAGGLGYDVLLALRALKVGEAMEAGLAIVALAIALDRLT
ncbi:MAG: ABC transporter permease subunit, partial [Mesorhizobium sp.]